MFLLLMTLRTRAILSAVASLVLLTGNSCSGYRDGPPPKLPPRTPTSYYLDCSAATNGSGTQSSPWNSLSFANMMFVAGDHLLLNRGTKCNGSFTPRGSGSASAPIVVDAYGTGAKPVIDGGQAEEAIKLF